jgi:hypothetical protein
MCTFKNPYAAMVCDVAIGHVRHELDGALPKEDVHYTSVDGQGTLVEATPETDAALFAERVRKAIADAQVVL